MANALRIGSPASDDLAPGPTGKATAATGISAIYLVRAVPPRTYAASPPDAFLLYTAVASAIALLLVYLFQLIAALLPEPSRVF